jgi:hypothetical protein
MLMTEALAYPIAAWALFAMVRALHRPTLLRTALVAVLIGAACLVRTQLIALGGVFVAAVALDIVRGGRAQLAQRVRRHRVVLIAAAAGALARGALLLVGQRSFGTYSCVVADAPSPREIATPLSHYVGTIFVATLGLPHARGSVLGKRAVMWGLIGDALGAAAWVAVRVGGQRGVAIALAVTAAF